MNGVGDRDCRAGYVLVGGASSRMGRDKALLPFRGRPLVSAVADAVRDAAGSCVLVGDPARYSGLGFPVIPDCCPGEGPLGGILTALLHTNAEWNLIVACDMPGLTSGFLRELMAVTGSSSGDAVVPVGPRGMEPLCAVYRRGARASLEATFARGGRKVAAGLAELVVTPFPVAEVTPFQNVNTPEDWSRHAAE